MYLDRFLRRSTDKRIRTTTTVWSPPRPPTSVWRRLSVSVSVSRLPQALVKYDKLPHSHCRSTVCEKKNHSATPGCMKERGPLYSMGECFQDGQIPRMRFCNFVGPWCLGTLVPWALVPWAYGALGLWCLWPLVPWGLWCLGPLVPWAFGALGLNKCLGPLVPWAVGALGLWCLGPLVPWAFGALGLGDFSFVAFGPGCLGWAGWECFFGRVEGTQVAPALLVSLITHLCWGFRLSPVAHGIAIVAHHCCPQTLPTHSFCTPFCQPFCWPFCLSAFAGHFADHFANHFTDFCCTPFYPCGFRGVSGVKLRHFAPPSRQGIEIEASQCNNFPELFPGTFRPRKSFQIVPRKCRCNGNNVKMPFPCTPYEVQRKGFTEIRKHPYIYIYMYFAISIICIPDI